MGVSMAAVATAWSLVKGCNPIVGMNSKARIDDACKNIKVRLADDDIKYLEDAYLPKPVTGY
jgi:aryl-alcohol dehydrogenase-like predicted oxidoreductase